MAKASKMPRTAKCHRCGKRIYPRKSRTTGEMSLLSGIRKHYWDKHRRVMLKGVTKREQRRNPGWKAPRVRGSKGRRRR